MKGKVSLIVPAYNAEKYIGYAIRSVICQSWENWELLIVNDGSTDQTEIVCQRFCDTDPRIKLFTTENRGVSAARNLGLDNATGEYTAFLDADDALPETSLELRVKYLEENPGVDGVDGVICIKDEFLRLEVGRYRPCYQGEWLPRLVALDGKAFFNVCFLFRSRRLNGIRFNVTLSHAEDLEFFIRLSKVPFCYGFVEGEVYIYRRHPQSAMGNIDGLQLGYLGLVHTIDSLDLSFAEKLLFRFKTSKIMLACRLARKQPLQGIRNATELIFRGWRMRYPASD